MGVDIVFAIALACLFFGFVVGNDLQWRSHRRHCDCQTCSQWRRMVRDKAAKLAGDRK